MYPTRQANAEGFSLALSVKRPSMVETAAAAGSWADDAKLVLRHR